MDPVGFRGLMEGTAESALALSRELGGTAEDGPQPLRVWSQTLIHERSMITAAANLPTPMLTAASSVLERVDKFKRHRMDNTFGHCVASTVRWIRRFASVVGCLGRCRIQGSHIWYGGVSKSACR